MTRSLRPMSRLLKPMSRFENLLTNHKSIPLKVRYRIKLVICSLRGAAWGVLPF
jgi:hypothetical protein